MISSIFNLLILKFLLSSANATPAVQIIDAQALKLRLNQVSLIDARDDGFEEGHVPRSISVHWKDWTLKKPNLLHFLTGNAQDWGKVPLPNQELQNRLEALGISRDKEIVIIGKPHGWGEEGRFAWQFLYWGAKRVSLLDGGIDAWRALELPLEKGRSGRVARGDFKIEIDSRRRASVSDVEEASNSSARILLDARSREEFEGKRMIAQKRGGHIPHARSLPVLLLYEADGKYISAEKLKKLAAVEGRSPITYCVGGVRSALLAMLLEARLGIITANYDASIWEWSEYIARPLVGGKD